MRSIRGRGCQVSGVGDRSELRGSSRRAAKLWRRRIRKGERWNRSATNAVWVRESEAQRNGAGSPRDPRLPDRAHG